MRHSWKQHAAAAAVSVVVFGLYSYVTLQHRYSRDRSVYMEREGRFYDHHTNGKGGDLLVVTALVASVVQVAIAVIPYQLTLAAINSKRLSGED